jgi:hypothetical protein
MRSKTKPREDHVLLQHRSFHEHAAMFSARLRTRSSSPAGTGSAPFPQSSSAGRAPRENVCRTLRRVADTTKERRSDACRGHNASQSSAPGQFKLRGMLPVHTRSRAPEASYSGLNIAARRTGAGLMLRAGLRSASTLCRTEAAGLLNEQKRARMHRSPAESRA